VDLYSYQRWRGGGGCLGLLSGPLGGSLGSSRGRPLDADKMRELVENMINGANKRGFMSMTVQTGTFT